MKRKISLADVTPIELEGRNLSWVINNETVGARQMSVAVMHCFPNAVVKPLHAHREIEEVIYILSGTGEAWIDGELVSFTEGDSVFFPANSKHQVRNTGSVPLRTVSIFSALTSPDDYISYPESAFPDTQKKAGV